LIYGIHQMLNCVCGPGGEANAVLLRSAEPVEASLPWLHGSGSGPGNLCKAFGVQRRHNRGDLCDPESELIILPRPPGASRPRTVRGPRIGVDYAGVWSEEPLRFCDGRSAHLSRPAGPPR
jgi:DNA-3-methyladenine glycosylase